MSSNAVLFYEVSTTESESVLPMNTLMLSDVTKLFLDEVNFHLDNIIQSFFAKKLENPIFWVLDKDEFDPEEEMNDEPFYAELEADHSLEFNGDSYAVARELAAYILGSSTWKDYVVQDRVKGYKLNSFRVEDIPTTAPTIKTAKPIDPRFERGEWVINRNGRRFKYNGVLFGALNPRLDEANETSSNKTILIGVKNSEYVAEREVEAFVESHAIEVFPISKVYMASYVKAGKNWFARFEGFDVEGLGSTVEDAKRDFAVMALTSPVVYS
jgi:hypothetical protein